MMSGESGKMELYHNNMSVCAQKVRLVLAAKGLRPIEHHMMIRNGDVHTPQYLKINPKGVVPTLIDKGAVIVESTVICEYLDDAYETRSLSPTLPIERAQMRQWTLLPDAGLHAACGALSVAVAWRHQMLAAGGAQLANRPAQNGGPGLLRELIEHGLDSTHIPPALALYDSVVSRMVDSLSANEWLVGNQYSLADISMLPYIARLEDLGLAWFWEGRRAVVGDWLKKSKSLPSYRGISDYYDLAYVELATQKGREATPQLRKILEHLGAANFSGR